MEKDILKKNKIPGCEKLTRPEEITTLRKFLGEIKRIQDENTVLDETELEIPGKTTGKIPEITKLPDNLEKLNLENEKKLILSDYLEKLNNIHDINSLEGHRENIEVSDIDSLSNYRENIEVPEVDSLEDYREDIKTTDIDSLSDYRENIEVSDINSLPDYRENIEVSDIDKLSDYREDIETTDIDKLSDYRENIEVPEVDSLENYRENIEVNDIDSLSNYREDIEATEINKLSDYRENIEVSDIDSLSDYRENIETTDIDSLSDYREDIEVSDIDKISDYRENIEVPEINKLSDYRENIEVPEVDSLENYRENIEATDVDKLSDYRENIEVPEVDSLENYRENIEVSDIDKLSDYRENIEVSDIDKLSDYRENIETTDIDSLSDYRENIEVSDIDKLSDYRENIEVPEVDSLEDYREDIEVPEVDSLEDYRENIEVPEINKLSDYRENIEVSDIDSLPDYRENIETTDIDKLSDYRENIEVSDIDKLSDYRENIEVSDIDSLPDYRENIETTNIDSLSDYREDIEVSDIDKLSDYKENIETTDIDKLSDYRENIETTDIDSLSDYREDIETTDIDKLSDYREDIEVPEVDSLEDYREDIEVPEVESLEDYREDIEVPEVDSLEDYREDIEVPEVESLEDYREDIEVPEVDSLEDYREDIEVSDIDSLSDYRENIETTDIDKLSDYREDIEVPEVDSLEDYREDIEVPEVDSLEDYREDIEVPEVDSLEDYREDIEVPEVESLEDYREDIEVPEVESLEDYREDIEVPEVESLEDYREDIEVPEVDSLEDYREDIEVPEVDSLEDFLDSIETTEVDSLEDFKDTIEVSETDSLEDFKDQLPPEKAPESSEGYNYFDPSEDGNGLYDAVIERPNAISPSTQDSRKSYEYSDETFLKDHIESTPSYGLIGKEGYVFIEGLFNEESSILEEISLIEGKENITTEDKNKLLELEKRLLSIRGKIDSFFEEYKKDLADFPTAKSPSTQDSKRPYKYFDPSIEGNELYDHVLYVLRHSGTWGQKLSSYVCSYLNSSEIPDEKAREFECKLYEEKQVLEDIVGSPEYKLPGFNLGMINPSSYLRFLAEKTVGIMSPSGGLRQLLLNETLSLLVWARDYIERSTGSNRDRLPGDDSVLSSLGKDFIQGGLKQAASNVVGNILGSIIPNRDKPINRPSKDSKKNNKVWESANNRTTTSSWDKGISDTYSFKDNYLRGEGINITLSELCYKSDSESIESAEQLFDKFRKSPYITVPEKFMTTGKGAYRTTTLDSNSHWEIVFEPYVGTENGNVSYLPAIQEINTRNKIWHGVNTNYNRWIPFISFDLQKSKLSSKSIGLFGGDIYYPASLETINELRLTIVDDQYKSWRKYFEDCMLVSVYNSELHEDSYYTDDGYNGSLTAIDKTNICLAMYKNISFRCIIYVMTPQSSTITKYDFLVVLRDFMEEYSGDIDSGGSDLTVAFSIVGENPVGKLVMPSEPEDEDIPKEPPGNDYATILKNKINSVISLIG